MNKHRRNCPIIVQKRECRRRGPNQVIFVKEDEGIIRAMTFDAPKSKKP